MRLMLAPIVLCLTGCGSTTPTGQPANAIDPVIADTVGDPIMVDPGLDRQANRDALRPADEPFSVPIPPGTPTAGEAPTLDEQVLAAIRPGGGFETCAEGIGYTMSWAARLPPALALPPAAQVLEAAGSERGTCRLRIVRYTVANSPSAALDYWRVAAQRDGYALESGGDTVTARRVRDGGVLNVKATAQPGGSTVAVILNRGT